jgi:hypothetical protein
MTLPLVRGGQIVAPVTLVVGVLLVAVGLAGYWLQDAPRSWTALIPAFLGVAFLVLGSLAYKDHLRKHAMHAAAALGLLGVLTGLGRLLAAAVAGKLTLGLATICISLMIVLCAVFVGLCVNSFIQARRRRAGNEAEGT